MTLYPGAIDDGATLPNPSSTSKTNNPSHASLHDVSNDAIKAVETKLGTGSSTPAANTLLRGSGAGTSAWAVLTSAQLAASISDETGSGSAVFATTPTLVTPKVDTINEATPSNGTTIGGVNIKSGTLNTNNSVVTANITDNAVTASKLATNAITLGYAQITTNFSTVSTMAAQITGLTTTVTIPSGGRKVKITGFASDMFAATAADYIAMTIWDGTVGSGTQLARGQMNGQGTAGQSVGIVMAVVTPAAGSKTYNIGLQTGSASHAANIEAAASFPAFILVETI